MQERIRQTIRCEVKKFWEWEGYTRLEVPEKAALLSLCVENDQ